MPKHARTPAAELRAQKKRRRRLCAYVSPGFHARSPILRRQVLYTPIQMELQLLFFQLEKFLWIGTGGLLKRLVKSFRVESIGRAFVTSTIARHDQLDDWVGF